MGSAIGKFYNGPVGVVVLTDSQGMIRSIFLYLDRSYLLPSSSLQSIEATGLALFRKHIASDSVLEPKFLRGIFTLFEQDRQNQGQIINIILLLSCIRLVSSLGLYTQNFEPRFITVSRAYFSRLAEYESTSSSLTHYLAECTTQLTSESSRCDRFHLDLTTKRSLIAVIEDEMVRKRLPILTDRTSVGALLISRDFTPLATLYSLLDRVTPAGEAIRPAWETHITTFGASIVTDDARIEDMVPRLLEFKHALDTMYAIPFKRDDTLGYTLRESFAAFINARRPGQQSSNNSKPAEMIAKFVDLLLRTGTKGLPASTTKEMVDLVAAAGDDDAQLAFQLEQVLDLFRFIHGKDVFEAFYKKDLARRLLMGRSASADAERMMLAKLKTECGSGFTHNLEGMFKDVDLSREAVTSFKTSKASNLPGNVDLFVNVLSASAWPTYPEIAVNIPAGLARYLDAFQEFYVTKHSGRKLAWRHGLAHCVLKASFAKGNKELALSAFQAVVLLLFNDPTTPTLSFSDLLTASGLPADQLTRTLQSMACGKHRVLAKLPKSKDVNPTDRFSVNTGFTDLKFRVKINQIQLKETKEEVKETHERVTQDRQYETQAAIIRIMKGRKTVRHAELVGLTIEQTRNRGVLDVGDIKKNIERYVVLRTERGRALTMRG